METDNNIALRFDRSNRKFVLLSTHWSKVQGTNREGSPCDRRRRWGYFKHWTPKVTNGQRMRRQDFSMMYAQAKNDPEKYTGLFAFRHDDQTSMGLDRDPDPLTAEKVNLMHPSVRCQSTFKSKRRNSARRRNNLQYSTEYLLLQAWNNRPAVPNLLLALQ